MKRLATATTLCVIATLVVGAPGNGAIPLPNPDQTYPDRKPFNALQLGPGNTFAVKETPKDYELISFAFQRDGKRVALGWESGRVEIYDLESKRRVVEFNPGLGAVYVLEFTETPVELVVVGPKGKLAFIEPDSGKKLREWKVPLGKYKFDLQVIIVDPKGKWLAYADEESSKVLDMAKGPDGPLADLKDAGSISLSPEGDVLWTLNRSKLGRFDATTWKQTGEWALPSKPFDTSPVRVRSGASESGRVVGVHTKDGLLVYREPEMQPEKIGEPAAALEFDRTNRVFVNFSREVDIIDTRGKIICSRAYDGVEGGHQGNAMSADGHWLGLSWEGKLRVWDFPALLRDCTAKTGAPGP
jgi:hypothetical protein